CAEQLLTKSVGRSVDKVFVYGCRARMACLSALWSKNDQAKWRISRSFLSSPKVILPTITVGGSVDNMFAHG
ncbi:MAG: hypothetical protein RSD81_13715, partial [Pseudomonas sp.]